ncbi:MAG: flagellar protein FlaG [Desulfobacteraceae bacterium Eth-SRB1]|nr:MAG: flagellar protein FlaG [Desulfobacteraceae bacterium Eth-SRB1]
MNKLVASGSPRAEEDHVKTFEPEISGSVDNQQARELTEKLQGYIDRMNINIAFATYGGKNKNISIVVSEKETGEIIRKIPPEELQGLHAKMEELSGMLFNGMV